MEKAAIPTAQRKRRWFVLTPGRLIVGLLLVQALLWLSEWFYWPEYKSIPLMWSLLATGAVVLFMLVWFVLSLSFSWSFQFSFRALLLLVVVIATPCSWTTFRLKRLHEVAAIEEEAIKRIQGAGGDSGWSMGDPFGPYWQKSVSFHRPNFSDDELANTLPDIRRLVALEDIDLWGTSITDRSVALLSSEMRDPRGLPRIQRLVLSKTRVTDVGLEQLEGLYQLRYLKLNDTNITDAGAERLRSLTHLKRLEIEHTAVTAEGVEKLRRALTNCEIEWEPPVTVSSPTIEPPEGAPNDANSSSANKSKL